MLMNFESPKEFEKKKLGFEEIRALIEKHGKKVIKAVILALTLSLPLGSVANAADIIIKNKVGGIKGNSYVGEVWVNGNRIDGQEKPGGETELDQRVGGRVVSAGQAVPAQEAHEKEPGNDRDDELDRALDEAGAQINDRNNDRN